MGQQGLAFDRGTRRYFELSKVEREVFFREEGDVGKQIERRMEKYNCVEPFLESNRQKWAESHDDKRRIASKDRLESIR